MLNGAPNLKLRFSIVTHPIGYTGMYNNATNQAINY